MDLNEIVSAGLWTCDPLPKGVLWPCFEDGTPVAVGSVACDGAGQPFKVECVEFFDRGITLVGDRGHLHLEYGEAVERPSRKEKS
jgi:hypothetical protein